MPTTLRSGDHLLAFLNASNCGVQHGISSSEIVSPCRFHHPVRSQCGDVQIGKIGLERGVILLRVTVETVGVMNCQPGVCQQNIAALAPKVEAVANRLTDDLRLDPLSGNAVLNGVPVELAPADQEEGALR